MRWTLLVAAVALVACTGGQETACDGAVTRPDRPVPRVEGPSVEDGSLVRLEAGRPHLVNVWGSWCGPCRLEQPLLNRAAERHQDVRFLGLAVQDDDAGSRAFRREFSVRYPSISDFPREIAHRLGAVNTPASFVVDAGGTIRGQVQGAVTADTLECMIGLVK